MDNITAKNFAIKVRAYHYGLKILEEIEKNGEADIKLSNSGFHMPVKLGDACYLNLKSSVASLMYEIRSYEITQKTPVRRMTTIAPCGAAPETESAIETKPKLSSYQRMTPEERKAFNRRHYEARKAKMQQI